MKIHLSLQRKIGAGLGAIALIATLIGVLGVGFLKSAISGKDELIAGSVQQILESERLHGDVEKMNSAARAYLFDPEDEYLKAAGDEYKNCLAQIATLRKNASPESKPQLDRMEADVKDYYAAASKIMALTLSGVSQSVVFRTFSEELAPKRERLTSGMDEFLKAEEHRAAQAKQRSSDESSRAVKMLMGAILGAIAAAVVLAVYLSSSLARQIGSAIQNIQSSSAQLQAAAAEQATGSAEQASTATEVNTTIRELLATSRQIAESAQRVSRIAAETATSAHAGDQTVERAQEALSVTKRQVELIVGHMVELGRKSQQIGGILEIINELAEQTNILAINATIESAGAGESGKRFSVVADEIRKLADRVGGSTREIRSLVDEIRGSANTTVMATESGSKAVEAGAKQFGEVTNGFKQISRLVQSTSEAAREIEISTKQQATAVEQVNVAISNVAQAAKESEVSTKQTLQTSVQLAALSRELSRLIRPNELN